ncbi:hypothetical protein J5N97_012703 [Dioscorea zingiberensis]|uniref:Uncharacterized protein n=1 Tax=Dioscorea zingiberensis TaxID=325984 RepID=A0A9D5CQJ2_9LILI|nr:hypothetical protein J5N97_012703 [Dioscorea zingiberensis]
MDEHSDLDDWEILPASGGFNGVVVEAIQSDYFSLNFTKPIGAAVPESDLVSSISSDDGSASVDALESGDGEPMELESGDGELNEMMVSNNEDLVNSISTNHGSASVIESVSSNDDVPLIEHGGIAEVFSGEDGVDLGVVDRESRTGEADKVEADSDPDVLPVAETEKREMAWWKMPIELLKNYGVNVNPVYCLPVAAVAIFGLVVVGNRLYTMQQQSRKTTPVKISVEQQNAYQVMVRAAHLNKACSITRQVPVIRSSQHHEGAISWPIVTLK